MSGRISLVTKVNEKDNFSSKSEKNSRSYLRRYRHNRQPTNIIFSQTFPVTKLDLGDEAKATKAEPSQVSFYFELLLLLLLLLLFIVPN